MNNIIRLAPRQATLSTSVLDSMTSGQHALFSSKNKKRVVPCSTPPGNTGVLRQGAEPITVLTGWLTASFRANGQALEIVMISGVSRAYTLSTFDQFSSQYTSARGYKRALVSDYGTLLAWTPGRDDFMLSVPQAAVERLTPVEFCNLVAVIKDLGGTFTRFDITIDDKLRRLSIATIQKSLQRGDYVGRSHDWEPKGKRDVRTGEFKSHGVCIGSRTSECFTRIYDKKLESKGKNQSIRVEMELKGDLADGTVCYLLDKAAKFFPNSNLVESVDINVWLDLLRGAVFARLDFRDSKSNTRLTNCKRLDWWAKFMKQVNELRLVVTNEEPSIDKARVWFETQVAPTLALLIEAAGDRAEEWVNQVVKDGKSKFKAKHRRMLKQVG